MGAFFIAAAWMTVVLAVIVAAVREVLGRLTGRGSLGWRVWLALGFVSLVTFAAAFFSFGSARLEEHTATYVEGAPPTRSR